MTETADILIVTPLALERRAARRHLVDLDSVQYNELSMDVGSYPVGRSHDATMRVAVIETGPGNLDAALLTLTALNELQGVRHVIACGIAGGYKDVQIGDVVASSKVYWAEAGKETDDGFRPRPDLGHVSPLMLQIARQVATDDLWQARSQTTVPSQLEFARPATALVGPIAVLESVVSGRATDATHRIAQHFGDTVAVDMEGFGVLKAAALPGRVGGIEIRGISDILVGKSVADAAGSQGYAAGQAAAFAFEVVERLHRATRPVRDDQWWRILADVAASTYPAGLQDRAVWTRAGGELAAIELSGPAIGQWHDAIRQLRNGGGGANLSAERLLDTMLTDHPRNAELTALVRGETAVVSRYLSGVPYGERAPERRPRAAPARAAPAERAPAEPPTRSDVQEPPRAEPRTLGFLAYHSGVSVVRVAAARFAVEPLDASAPAPVGASPLAVSADGRAVAAIDATALRVAALGERGPAALPWWPAVTVEGAGHRVLAVRRKGRHRLCCVVSTAERTEVWHVTRGGAVGQQALHDTPSAEAVFTADGTVWTLTAEGIPRQPGLAALFPDLERFATIDRAEVLGRDLVVPLGLDRQGCPRLMASVDGAVRLDVPVEHLHGRVDAVRRSGQATSSRVALIGAGGALTLLEVPL